MRSRAPFSAQLRVFHQNITCSMHTFPSRIESFWMTVVTVCENTASRGALIGSESSLMSGALYWI